VDQTQALLSLARSLALRRPDFLHTKGPGAGDHATIAFMRDLRAQALRRFGEDHAEQKICGTNGFCVDYYFRREATIVEVALGLPKKTTEFERDVLKAVMAKEEGKPVRRLIFLSKPGAIKKCAQPGRSAIIDWLTKNHRIRVEIHELGTRVVPKSP
jgi:hypothetical protein